MKFAYADPPYLGCARLYADHHPQASDWDNRGTHLTLLARLQDEYPDGWVLSCNPRDLRWVLPALPESARVGSWVKSWHQIRPTTVQHAWEPVVWMGGRKDNKRNPMVRDWLMANATRRRGLPGAKPAQFNRWVLDILNANDGDTVDDLFPGTHSLATERSQGVLTFDAPPAPTSTANTTGVPF